MRNFDYCKYTYIHRKIIMALVEKYIKDEKIKEEMIKRAKVHDLDKMTSYLFYDKSNCSKLHRENSSHHLGNNLKKEYLDYLEMILDWESARYSKSDKPLNAYQTLYAYYIQYEDKILPILKEYKLDSTNIKMDNDVLELAKRLENEVTSNLILEDIKENLKDF